MNKFQTKLQSSWSNGKNGLEIWKVHIWIDGWPKVHLVNLDFDWFWSKWPFSPFNQLIHSSSKLVIKTSNIWSYKHIKALCKVSLQNSQENRMKTKTLIWLVHPKSGSPCDQTQTSTLWWSKEMGKTSWDLP